MILTLKILGAIAALALGLWLGMPGRYARETHEHDVEEIMDRGGGRRHRARRHFTPLAWAIRQVKGESRRRSRAGRFRMERPDDR